jgi:hypothetical protein
VKIEDSTGLVLVVAVAEMRIMTWKRSRSGWWGRCVRE